VCLCVFYYWILKDGWWYTHAGGKAAFWVLKEKTMESWMAGTGIWSVIRLKQLMLLNEVELSLSTFRGL